MVFTVSAWKFSYTTSITVLTWRQLYGIKKGLVNDHEHLFPTKTLSYTAINLNRTHSKPNTGNGPTDDDENQLRASTQKLLTFVEREHVALVIFGHDGLQWQTLKKAPEYYG